jgi:ribosome-associated protein
LGWRAAHDRFFPSVGDTPLTRKKAPARHVKAKPAKGKKSAAKVAKKTVKASPQKSANKKPARPKSKKVAPKPRKAPAPSELLKRIVASLEDDKAEAIVAVNLEGRSSLCDAAVIASGRSSRHVMAIAEHLARRLKEEGYGTRPVTGAAQGDWVLVDAGDVIVHVFRPEVRDYYDLEGMWNVAAPSRA